MSRRKKSNPGDLSSRLLLRKYKKSSQKIFSQSAVNLLIQDGRAVFHDLDIFSDENKKVAQCVLGLCKDLLSREDNRGHEDKIASFFYYWMECC